MSNKETNRYVAAVFSMKKRWLERNPEAARLRIRVISKHSFDTIQNADSPRNVLPKKYRRWVKEGPTITCASEVDAWEAAIRIRDSMISDGRRVDLNFGHANHRLYVIEMDAKVAEHKAFKKMNGMIADLGSRTCVYVGLTSQEITERYAQHRSTTPPASTQWGKKFFFEPFENAFREDFVKEFADAGNCVEALNKDEALRGELELRCWLQNRGAAAYSN